MVDNIHSGTIPRLGKLKKTCIVHSIQKFDYHLLYLVENVPYGTISRLQKIKENEAPTDLKIKFLLCISIQKVLRVNRKISNW